MNKNKLTSIIGTVLLGLTTICPVGRVYAENTEVRYFTSIENLQEQMLEIASLSKDFSDPYLECIPKKDRPCDCLRFSLKKGQSSETQTYIFEKRTLQIQNK